MDDLNLFPAGSEKRARLARLTNCDRGDQVVIPDGWTAPDDAHGLAVTVRDLEPGVVFTHDGGTDRLPWHSNDVGYAYSRDLATLGLESESTLERWAALDAVPVCSTVELSPPRTFGPDDYWVGMGEYVRIAAVRRSGNIDGHAMWRLKPDGVDVWMFSARSEQIDALGLTPEDFTAGDDDDRLARLCAAAKGDTVTVPDGWEKPGAAGVDPLAVRRADLRPGDVFTNDGTADNLRWAAGLSARARVGNVPWYSSEQLAVLGLDVDTTDDTTAGDDAPAGPRVTVSDAVPEGIAIAGDFTADGDEHEDEHDEHDGDGDESTSIGTVTVNVVPDTTAFEDRIKAVAAEVSGTLRGLDEELEALPRPVSVITGSPLSGLAGHLDEYGQERLAALELAMRVLEARRRPSGIGTGVAGLIGSGPGKMVDVQDMIDVAAFIATGDTGRLEDEQEDQA